MTFGEDTYLEETSPNSETSHDDHDRATPPNDTTVALDVNETPSTRVLRIARTEAVKERVDIATEDLTQRRCIVHNTEHIYAVEYAHVLPRASKDSLLANLENSWNMTEKTLNVDTRYNIFHLSAEMHRMFDRGKWLLVPEQRVVNIFKQKLTKPVQEYVAEPAYRYRLIASKDMIHFPIFRLDDPIHADPPQMLDLAAGILETFVYPFHNFPPIISHVKPHFIIFNVGEQMTKLQKTKGFRHYVTNNGQYQSILGDIIEIYQKWINPGRPVEVADGGDNDDDDEEEDEDYDDSSYAETSATKPHRLNERYLKRSLNEDDEDNDDSRPRRRSRRASTKRVVDSDGVSLDSKTLWDVDEPTCGSISKTVYIEEWISKVSSETYQGMPDINLDIN